MSSSIPETGTSYLEAIRQAMGDCLEADERMFIYGEDVEGPFGGAFKATKGLGERFPGRVRNSPISEDAIAGMAIGAALAGSRPLIEFQFADFSTPAFNQLVNNAGTTYWRTGQACPITARFPVGGTPGGGPFHSQMTEAWLSHHPGLVLVAPATVQDAYSLMCQSMACDDPVFYLEHKHLYYHLRDPAFNTEAETLPLTKARIHRSGSDCTIITYSAMVHAAEAAAEALALEGIQVEIVDLRCLKPLDLDTILASIARTSHALILSESWPFGGVSAEVSAQIAEQGFHLLDTPIRRINARNTPIPFHPALWRAHRPDTARIQQVVQELMRY